jgi:hypothetical protein
MESVAGIEKRPEEMFDALDMEEKQVLLYSIFSQLSLVLHHATMLFPSYNSMQLVK